MVFSPVFFIKLPNQLILCSLIPGLRPLAPGPWPLASGPWPLASGLWPLAPGLWPLASGLWPLAPYSVINFVFPFTRSRQTGEMPRRYVTTSATCDTI